MKKLILFLVLFLLIPVVANAAQLTTGINVDGIGNLSLARKEYNLSLHTTLDYATITVATDGTASYTINVDGTQVEGDKVPVKEGMNKIDIAVTNGTTTENWTINLNVSREMEIDSDNPQTGNFLSIIEITGILIIGVCFYGYSKKYLMKKI